MWVVFLYEGYFLGSTASFKLFFAENGFVHGFKCFRVDEGADDVFLGETGDGVCFMGVDTGAEVACYTDVEGAVTTAGEDVDRGLFGGHWGKYTTGAGVVVVTTTWIASCLAKTDG